MIVLAVADSLIPDFAVAIPSQFQALLKPGKVQHVLALGNVSDDSTQTLLKQLSKQYRAVRGSTDKDHTLPLIDLVVLNNLRIGLISGFTVIPPNDSEILLIKARELDADVLLWAGSTEADAFVLEDKLFVNPGSITGAFTPNAPDNRAPSFCLLDVTDRAVTTYLYSLVDDQVKVEKLSYKKGEVIQED